MVRQLTAIMFTDMVGYTALMQEDEHRANADRERQRKVLEGAVASAGGRILQFVGDGTLSIFQSAVAAVESAIEIQRALQSATPPIPLRIGIHTGDVVHDENGVFGDGVNVASRIEGLGTPGSVLISAKVHDEVKNKPEIRTRSLGSFNLKNVKQPMSVFAVANEGLTVPDEAAMGSARATQARSIAVLPFLNMSSDPENEFFSDGITEEIINALTRVNGLQVTARTSSFAFKNTHADVREIAGRLGVTHVLEGSVRKAGNRVRVTAQLICAADGYHLMSEIYDGALDDIFALQDEISLQIVQQLAGHLRPVPTAPDRGHARSLVDGQARDSAAYDEYLRGRAAFARWSPDGAGEAIAFCERSIELDPDCSLPWSLMSTAYVFLGATGHLPPHQALGSAEKAATRALEIASDDGAAHSAMAAVRLFWHWDWEGAYRSHQKALSLTPGSAGVHQLYAMYLRMLGDAETALEEARVAVELDPLSMPIRLAHAEALLGAGRVREGESVLRTILADTPGARAAVEVLGISRCASGDLEGGLELFETLPDLAGVRFAGASVRGYAYALLGREDDARRMLELLDERASEQAHMSLSMDYALVHAGLGDLDRVFHHLDEAAERRLGGVVFMWTNPLWREDVRSDPRFERLSRRIRHPRARLAPDPRDGAR